VAAFFQVILRRPQYNEPKIKF